eukprot:CAMPEP_0119010712 /NCGR_PEP_ID=MMETSP1176-20130426/5195_1 /TAXON_ID=265551 /ORGANISM="Synedropsis recta cf, Strain CCMP1620" /LENGTH=80 /DNA_ID=CAMNT_0006963425 /DNA_START=53 /DNA_END=291 /DNA_ORIENTATION=+
MSSPTIFSTIRNHCDTAISAIHQVEAVTNILAKYEADQKALTNEKMSLEGTVCCLRIEKEKLEKAITELKNELGEIGNEL